MMNHFPINRTISHTYQEPSSQINARNRDSEIIEHLRRQNEFLKQQLAEILKVQTNDCSPQINNNFCQTWTSNNRHQDVEANFKNKMSKLKNRKSNRKSIERVALTTPNSPIKKSNKFDCSFPCQNYEVNEKKNISKNTSVYPLTLQLKENISRYDERRTEDTQRSIRNMVHSPKFIRNQMNIPALNFNPLNEYQAHNIPPRPKTHQRMQSAMPTYNYQRQVKNKRISQGFDSPIHDHQQSHPIELNQFVKSSKTNIQTTPNQKMLPLKLSKDNIVVENAKPSILSPRGNLYIEQSQARQKNEKQKHIKEEEQSSIQGDSHLSIQRCLRQEKLDRKLKYDIYLSQGQ